MSNENHFASASMLIRKPVKEVYHAFIDPEITSQFWFTHGSDKLEEGKSIEWKWEMYNHIESVQVLKLIPNQLILIQWGDDPNATVQWDFKAIEDDQTFVSIINKGFSGSEDEILSQIRDSTGGFHIVVAGLKAYLEHNIKLNLVADKAPAVLRNG